MKESKIVRLVRRMANDYGVSLDLRQGGRHIKVYYKDKFISILPNGNGSGFGAPMMNTMQHIRRAIEADLYGDNHANTTLQEGEDAE